MIKVQPIQELIPTEAFAALSPDALNTVVYDIARAARNHWVKLAENDNAVGSHWRFDYISGIQEVEMVKAAVAVVALVGEIPHILEDGSPALDLRKPLLGPRVPVVPVGQRGKHQNKKHGYYRAIPFRHTTPGKKGAPRGKTIGQEMGRAYAGHDAVADSKKLGKEIYKAARALTPTVSAPGQKTVYGGRLKPGMAPKLKAHHTTDIYAGMIREEKTYEKATQAQYVTFRTISTSVKEGWIRPAIPARHYASQVHEFVQKLAPQAIAALLEG